MTSAEHTDISALADDLAIRNLIGRLAHLTDYGELDDYIQLFTEDAVWQRESKQQRFEGAEQILAAAAARREQGIQGPGVDSCHPNTASSVELCGDGTAVAHSYVSYVKACRTAPEITATLRYVDRLIKRENNWRIASRTVLEF